MLQHLNRSEAELSVLLTDDAFIQELNAKHRGKNRPTDVLSFPQEDDGYDSPPGQVLLGDVAISLDTAARQAAKRRHSLRDEVAFLLAHGILHLIGYDHGNDEDEARMDAMTRELVAAASL
jgi:probable rRNA maturation factor